MNNFKVLLLSTTLLLGTQSAFAAEDRAIGSVFKVKTGITYHEIDAVKVYKVGSGLHTLVVSFSKKASRHSAVIFTSTRADGTYRHRLDNTKYQYNRLKNLYEQQEDQSEQKLE